MVHDPSSSSNNKKDEPDILDLQATPNEAKAETAAANTDEAPVEAGPESEAPASETVTGTESTAPEAAPDYTAGPSSSLSSTAPARSGTSTSGLIGAGILGGLIALLAAGAMQYAGYLPGSAPQAVSSDVSSEVAGLRAEIDGLKQQLSTIPAEAPNTADIEKRIAALEQEIGKPGGPDQETVSRMASLEERLAGLQAASDQARDAGNKTMSDLSNRLAEAEKTLREQPGETAVSRAIAATYLKASIDRGDPFLTELDTFAALAPEDPAVQELRSMAASGVKSRSQLTDMFNDQAKLIMDAVEQPNPGEGLTDRLLASARSLVSVRPVGNVEGNDAGAVLARMEDKLKNGDVKGAALEWEGLPEAGRKASEAYKADLDKRARADDLTKGLAERSATPAVNAG
jgi:hypothetical protein